MPRPGSEDVEPVALRVSQGNAPDTTHFVFADPRCAQGAGASRLAASVGWKLLPPAPGSSTLTTTTVGCGESPGEIVA